VTRRLYYHDSYLTDFSASILDKSHDGCRIYLDQTAFYPTSGGQPNDTGLLANIPVMDVVDEGDRIAHLIAAPVNQLEVNCRVDWKRRFDHMQQHTGQHLLSAVLIELLGIPTVSFHLGGESSTIDVGVTALEPLQVVAIEERTNEVVVENRPVTVSFESAAEAQNLRKPADREGPLRIVEIERLDRSACGGTHVRATGEIGPVAIRKLDKIRGNVRIEFLCGMRAVRRIRADFDALSHIARTFSAPLDETPSLAAAQFEALQSSEKARRRLAVDLARINGRELYQTTASDSSGVRRVIRRLPSAAIDEELRAMAQGFTAQPKALFVSVVEDPPAVLLAASEDSGVNAGALLKSALAELGGRGGGNARLAQGSVPSKDLLDRLLHDLKALAGD
jgi:alanyl-tRNA synthetase